MLRRVSAITPAPTFAAAATATGLAAMNQSAMRNWSYKPRMREYQFIFEDVMDMYKHYEKIGQGENANKETVDALFDACSQVCTNVFFPLYGSGDKEGVKFKDGVVTTPKGFKEAYDQYVQGGWMGISFPEELGGQNMPASIGIFTREMLATANWAFGMYPGLSAGCAQTLIEHGTPEQKETYLTKVVSGEWAGTMCLTEPHCGTDLAQIKSKAVPNEDGKSYKLTGTKIFISSGDHDLTENIIHIVLAKLPDAPSGTKGISLFIVPKYNLKADGSIDKSKRNVRTGRIENKMGIHASATCQMEFEESTAYLIGKPHDGMRQMFTFMNTARVGTAMEGIAHSELAFQSCVDYARDRMSMRSLSGKKNPEKVADAIIHHMPVKNLVLFSKCISEAGRCLLADMSKILDHYNLAKTEEERKVWDNKLGMYTPIAKAVLTELGLEASSAAMQVYGGHGYISDHGVEQIMRDARISTLYEGTTEVQSLDLIGRKIMLNKKNDFGKFQAKIRNHAMKNCMDTGVLGQCSRSLLKQSIHWQASIPLLKVLALRNRDQVSSASVPLNYYSGYMLLGYYWLRMAEAAKVKVDAKQDPDGFYQQKIDMCDYYFNFIFPRCKTHARIMMSDAKILSKINNDKLDLQ